MPPRAKTDHPGHWVIMTGINGRIPIKHDQHPEGYVDVSPDSMLCVDDDHAAAVMDAIDLEHRARGSHPDPDTEHKPTKSQWHETGALNPAAQAQEG